MVFYVCLTFTQFKNDSMDNMAFIRNLERENQKSYTYTIESIALFEIFKFFWRRCCIWLVWKTIGVSFQIFVFVPSIQFFLFFFWLIWDGFIVVAVVVTLVIVENIGISVWWAATRKCIYQMWMVNRSTTNNKMRIKCRKIGWQYQTHHSQIHFNVGFFSRCILKIVFCFCYSTCGVREKCFDRNRSAIKRTKWFTATTTLSTTITTKRWSFEHQSY